MPITYIDPKQVDTAAQVTSSNNTVTIRTQIPGKAATAPATAFPLKVEQIENVNTKNGLPDNSILKYNKAKGMWEPVPYAPASGTPTYTKRYNFVDSLEWHVQHDMNTTAFKETLVLFDGTKFTAKVKIIDDNSFVVYLTAAESGWVDVIFGI